jgi:hypothetical protein
MCQTEQSDANLLAAEALNMSQQPCLVQEVSAFHQSCESVINLTLYYTFLAATTMSTTTPPQIAEVLPVMARLVIKSCSTRQISGRL